MKKLFLTIVSIFMLGTQVWANEEHHEWEPIEVGSLKIYPIIDANTTMESSLLPQLGQYPNYAQIFANGPVPAVSQAFFLHIPDHNILFDTGWGQELRIKGNTLKILESNDIQPFSITDILLTHLDSDHIGGLVQAGKPVFPNATLWLAAQEADAWKNGKIKNRPDASIERALKLWEYYPDRIRLFKYGEEILPGIFAIDASGHTPGHTAFEIVSGPDKMIIGGDIIHIYQVQLQKPDLSTTYDMDMKKAAYTRKRLLNHASQERAIFGGMHFPLVSPVLKREDGGFMMREAR